MQRRLISSRLFLLFIMAALYSCTEQDKLEIEQSASAFDIKQGEASVLQSNQNFMKAFKAGDYQEVSDCYTTDAKVMAPNQTPIKGKEDIAQYFSGLMVERSGSIDLHTTKVWGDSTLLAEEGTYEMDDKKGKQTDEGNYIVLWKLESGNWKMYRQVWASIQPVSAIQPEKVHLPEK